MVKRAKNPNKMIKYCTKLEETTMCWSNTSQTWVKHWPKGIKHSSNLRQNWPDSHQYSRHILVNAGQLISHLYMSRPFNHQSSTSQTLVKHWSNTGQARHLDRGHGDRLPNRQIRHLGPARPGPARPSPAVSRPPTSPPQARCRFESRNATREIKHGNTACRSRTRNIAFATNCFLQTLGCSDILPEGRAASVVLGMYGEHIIPAMVHRYTQVLQ